MKDPFQLKQIMLLGQAYTLNKSIWYRRVPRFEWQSKCQRKKWMAGFMTPRAWNNSVHSIVIRSICLFLISRSAGRNTQRDRKLSNSSCQRISRMMPWAARLSSRKQHQRRLAVGKGVWAGERRELPGDKSEAAGEIVQEVQIQLYLPQGLDLWCIWLQQVDLALRLGQFHPTHGKRRVHVLLPGNRILPPCSLFPTWADPANQRSQGLCECL